MTMQEVFGAAKWLCAGKYHVDTTPKEPDINGIPHFPVLRAHFVLPDTAKVKKVMLRVVGLGYFHCYINGQEITEDKFLPLYTDYEVREKHPMDVQTKHRMYVPEYEVTQFLQNGDNVLAIHFGGGRYTYGNRWWREKYGDPKCIFRLTAETSDGVMEFVSDRDAKIGDSFVKICYFTEYEHHDYTMETEEIFAPDYDDSGWKRAEYAPLGDTEYMFSDCPPDRVMATLSCKLLREDERGRHYDCGVNTSGYPVLRIHGGAGETVKVRLSEERNEDGSPVVDVGPYSLYDFNQHFTVISDGKERIVSPQFMWFGFRYFTVQGDAEVLYVHQIHTDVKVNSSFDSDNDTLNWLYRAYVNTQLANMHGGIPSDCPHAEKLGYTGDGQLACHSAMSMIDAKAFYRKWIEDIGDCQDLYTGHVQYTAPFAYAGGGPGGWGCAIVELPYRYYKHYGDTEPMERLFPQMLRYFDYLEDHSENNLVTSDIFTENNMPGCFCLGEWCPPEQIILPDPFVNTYFYIKSMRRAMEIAKVIGRESVIPMLEERIKVRRAAVRAAYFCKWTGNFMGGVQAANAFAVDMGIGDARTYPNLVEAYRKSGSYDTGIFGTDILTRVLFEHGDGQLAFDLLTADTPVSFEAERKRGATTLWEKWPDFDDRSHNHPMYGAVAAYLFDHLAGIGQPTDGAGYGELVIAPVIARGINRLRAMRTIPAGEVTVAYEKAGETVDFRIVIPSGVSATFRCGDTERALDAGENVFTATL